MNAAPVDAPLSVDQITSFKENGFVVLEKCIAAETIAAWNAQFWSHLGAASDDPSSWPDDYVIKDFSVEPLLGQIPVLQGAAKQLGGGVFGGGGGSMLVQWPKKDQTQWQPPAQGHIDGYGPGGWSGGFMLGATAYMEDVAHGGGAFTYWPQSHLAVHRFFREFPEQIDGSFTKRDDWEEKQWGLFSDPSPCGPEEFVARAGDVILWHCFMCHTGSVNVGSRPRLAVFSRWHHQQREQMRYDIPEDLWKYWGI
jgi:hypothetical protein